MRCLTAAMLSLALITGSPVVFAMAAEPSTTPVSATTATVPVDVPLKPDLDIIEALSHKGFFTAFPENCFMPEAPMTRSEFVTMLYKASELKTPFVSEFAYFRDIPTDHPAYLSIEGFRIRKILSGGTTGFFYPDAPITRLEAAILAGRTLPEGWLRLTPAEVLSVLETYPEISPYMPLEVQDEVAQSIYAGLLTPVSRLSADKHNTLLVMDLEQPLARMDAARLIFRRLDMAEESHRPRVEEAVAIPPEVILNISPTSAISREQVSVGETLYFALVEPVETSSDKLLLPRGARLHGLVTEVGANHLSATVRLDKILLPSGESYPLKSTLILPFGDRDKEAGFWVPGQNLTIKTH